MGQLATVKGLECDFKRFLIQLSYVAVRFEHYLFLLHFYCRPLEAIKMQPVDLLFFYTALVAIKQKK